MIAEVLSLKGKEGIKTMKELWFESEQLLEAAMWGRVSLRRVLICWQTHICENIPLFFCCCWFFFVLLRDRKWHKLGLKGIYSISTLSMNSFLISFPMLKFIKNLLFYYYYFLITYALIWWNSSVKNILEFYFIHGKVRSFHSLLTSTRKKIKREGLK